MLQAEPVANVDVWGINSDYVWPSRTPSPRSTTCPWPGHRTTLPAPTAKSDVPHISSSCYRGSLTLENAFLSVLPPRWWALAKVDVDRERPSVRCVLVYGLQTQVNHTHTHTPAHCIHKPEDAPHTLIWFRAQCAIREQAGSYQPHSLELYILVYRWNIWSSPCSRWWNCKSEPRTSWGKGKLAAISQM